MEKKLRLMVNEGARAYKMKQNSASRPTTVGEPNENALATVMQVKT
jgi:hypothetical protein